MTDKQFEAKQKALCEEMRSMGYGWIDGKYIKPPKQYETQEKELSCISMINSILAYSCHGMTDAQKVMEHEETSYHNYLADYVKLLGRNKVITLIQGQIDSISHVQHCVFRDSEGISYNSIIWKEEN